MSDSILPEGEEMSMFVLPLRNSVLFPAAVVPVNVARPRSVRLIEEISNQKTPTLLVVSQKNHQTEDPTFEEINTVGTVARILKIIRLNSGNYSVVIQGICRAKLKEPTAMHPCMQGIVSRIPEYPTADVELRALAFHLREQTRQLMHLLPGKKVEALALLDKIEEPHSLVDLIVANLKMETPLKQRVLETIDLRQRLNLVTDYVNRQVEIYKIKKNITKMVREDMSKSQREFLLRQQLKAIKQELGEDGDEEDEISELFERVAQAELPNEADAAARKELKRMNHMNSASSEYQVARNYVEWLLDIPWHKRSGDRLNVAGARRVLDEDHHGLDKPKKRIVEYVAVRKLKNNIRGPILCFVGPPGVGKTSLAKSIARATRRELSRVSLGGVSDEAEIRGHRRTYVGAFPGRIAGALKEAGTKNPVILLDEVDKMARNHRGDPASAMLEVLDPAQNGNFRDHYLEVPLDLSEVLFIATANDRSTIPAPLLDRMEVIEIPGYVREEKIEIARSFVLPRQLEEHGLNPERMRLSEEGLAFLIDGYTREAGVRGLDKVIASLCRSVAVDVANGEDAYADGSTEWIESVLGPRRFDPPIPENQARPGIATGLAWTPAGGTLLFVEANRVTGRGRVRLTGQAGDILKESTATAFSYIRSHADQYGLPHDFLSSTDVHVHFPDGAMKKDIASAGITIYTALLSSLSRHRVRTDTAMTGEITLRGNVLRVSSIKEKCLAAHRAGMKQVILPKENEPDLEEVPEFVREALTIRLVEKADEVLEYALEDSSDFVLSA